MTAQDPQPSEVVIYLYHCQSAGCRYEHVDGREFNEPYDMVPHLRTYESEAAVVSHGLCSEHVAGYLGWED